MSIGTILVILLVLVLVGVFPGTPWHTGMASYGYWPAGGVGGILVVVIVLLLLGIL